MSETGPERVRSIAASAWAFRWRVEREAEVRFERLAGRMERLGDPAELVALARRASGDERRHAAICARRAAALGEPPAVPAPPEVAEVAPRDLSPRDRVLYEVVAACCITETESMGVLATLLAEAREPGLRSALHALAQDEVRHARLGWAYLARAGETGDVAFLGPLVPAMLAGSVEPGLFGPAAAGADGEALLQLGVLPHRLKREVLERALLEVVFPGLERLGVGAGSARRWLTGRQGGEPASEAP